MAFKVILIILVILIGLILVLPFVLSIVGINVLQFGSVSGGVSAGSPMILRSTDMGRNWENASVSGSEKVPFPSKILHFAFHPRNPDFFYLGTRGDGLWTSANGGAFWTKRKDKLGVLDPRADVLKIGVSSSSPDVLYVAIYQDRRGRILRSDNNGESFHEVYFTAQNGIRVTDVFVNQSEVNHVIIVTDQGGMVETRNGGSTWRVIKWFSRGLKEILVNPKDPKEMFVLTDVDTLLKSTDGGESWTDLQTGIYNAIHPSAAFDTYAPIYTPSPVMNPFNLGFARNGIMTIIPDPKNFSALYIILSEGIFRSVDGGFLWDRINVLLSPDALSINTVAIHPRNSETILVGAQSQLYRSDDGGATWSINTLPVKSRIRTLIPHPFKPETMFAIF